MATITESRVRVHVEIHLNDAGEAEVVLHGRSETADGQVVRSVVRDITKALTAARRTSAKALVEAAATALRQDWQITDPTAPDVTAPTAPPRGKS